MRCLKSKGAFMVKGVLRYSLIRELAMRAEAAYAAWDGKHLDGPFAAQYHHGHIPVSELGHADIISGYLSRFVSAGFLSRYNNILLRRILPPSLSNERVARKIEFHQDEYFGQQVTGRHWLPLSLTAWVPLVPCGNDAPGLSVVLGSDAPIVQGEPPEGWPEYIRKTYGKKAIWSPPMEPGDVLCFTSRTIHGSYVTQGMTKPRYSIEIRGDMR